MIKRAPILLGLCSFLAAPSFAQIHDMREMASTIEAFNADQTLSWKTKQSESTTLPDWNMRRGFNRHNKNG